jgi:hypothetical protein
LGNLTEILRVCFSANALVTGIVTIGLISIITYISFVLERKVSVASSFFKKSFDKRCRDATVNTDALYYYNSF